MQIALSCGIVVACWTEVCIDKGLSGACPRYKRGGEAGTRIEFSWILESFGFEFEIFQSDELDLISRQLAVLQCRVVVVIRKSNFLQPHGSESGPRNYSFARGIRAGSD